MVRRQAECAFRLQCVVTSPVSRRATLRSPVLPARGVHSSSGQVLWSDSPGSWDIGRYGLPGADGLASGENARWATFDCSSISKRSTWKASAADTPCVNSELLPALPSAAFRLAA
jgi:hypothetical protein